MEQPNKEAQSIYKIIILGESNVGKSSLFLRYTEDRFKDAIANTIGINNCFKELVIDGQVVHLQMWDTAGQERFRSIVSSFYREADGFILVYDVASDRSYDYLEQLADELAEVIDPCFTVIAGNKIDTLDELRLSKEKSRLEELAKARNYRPWLVSAKTGKSVNQMFEELARSLLKGKNKQSSRRAGIDIASKKKHKRFWCFN